MLCSVDRSHGLHPIYNRLDKEWDISTYLYHISLEQHCWLDRRQERWEDLSPVYIKATDWACSHRMISQPVFLFEILAFHSLSPPLLLSPHFSHYSGTFLLTWAPAAAVSGAARLASQFSRLSTDASLERCKWLLHKSWVTYRQILPTPKLPEHTAKPERERDGGVFLATGNCRMSAFNPSPAPNFFLYLFLFHSSVLNPLPHPQ